MNCCNLLCNVLLAFRIVLLSRNGKGEVECRESDGRDADVADDSGDDAAAGVGVSAGVATGVAADVSGDAGELLDESIVGDAEHPRAACRVLMFMTRCRADGPGHGDVDGTAARGDGRNTNGGDSGVDREGSTDGNVTRGLGMSFDTATSVSGSIGSGANTGDSGGDSEAGEGGGEGGGEDDVDELEDDREDDDVDPCLGDEDVDPCL